MEEAGRSDRRFVPVTPVTRCEGCSGEAPAPPPSLSVPMSTRLCSRTRRRTHSRQPYHAEHSGAAAVPSLSSALFRVVLRASRSALPLPRARTRRCRRWAGTLRAHRCRTNSGSPALRLRLL